jgi:long-chain acyl-CoA synthetase
VHNFAYGDVIREHRRSRPELLAVVDGDVRLTWRQLDDRVNRLRSALVGIDGLAPRRAPGGMESDEGGLVLWMGQNSHRLLETILAAAKMGARVLPANWRSSATEMADIIARTRPTLVIWQNAELAGWCADVRDLTAGHPAHWVAHDIPGEDGYEELLAAENPSGLGVERDLRTDAAIVEEASADDEAPVNPDRPLLVLMTAAFEGRPLGAQLTHRALLLQGLQIGHTQAMTEDARTLVAGPMFHIAALLSLNATYCWGGRCVLIARSEGVEVARAIEAERCTHGFIPGPVLQEIRDEKLAVGYDLTSMFPTPDAVNPAAPIVSEPASLWQRRPGLAYGQTETTGIVVLSSLSATYDAGRGKPPPLAAVRIVGPEGTEAAVDEVGEIVVRGPMVMAGYLGEMEATKARFADGWHHTNDLGRRHQDGSISFVGPKSALIKSGSENIYPAEVERCLLSHPGVAEVCVIGVPDPLWTQNVKAIVVARRGADIAGLSVEALAGFCRERMASYKKPKEVQVVVTLPKAGGFIDRDTVNRLYGGGGYPGTGTG